MNSNDYLKYYKRKIYFLRNKIKNFDEVEFFEYIKNKEIVIVGVGGIGSVLVELLVRNGFLNLKIVDDDIVDISNLQRQIFNLKDVGELKINAIEKKIKLINEKAKLIKVIEKIDETNVSEILKKSDLVVDCVDNFKTRRIINEFCLKEKKDWIYNGAINSEIVNFVFLYKNNDNKKYSKIFQILKSNEINNENLGVLASTTFISASIAFNQILKYFLKEKYGLEIENKFIKIDLWNNKFNYLDF